MWLIKSNTIMLDNKDITINIGGEGSFFHMSILNKQTDQLVTSYITRQKLKELVSFFKEHLENN
jgi:hypothetical protein